MREKPDFYTDKAKKAGYPARSVYKLEEIDNKFHLIKPGDRVLDLGAAPGSWSMFIAEKLKSRGFLAAVDLNPLSIWKTKKPENACFFQGDIFGLEIEKTLLSLAPFSLVLSDAAPGTTGNRLVDTCKSYALAERIINLSGPLLSPGGSLVIKVFQGGDEGRLVVVLKNDFTDVKMFKPKASRKESFEVFIIAQRKKGKQGFGIVNY